MFPDLEPCVESLELSRFVLSESVPGNGESWFLARCWQLAVRDGVRGAVGFSDPMPRRAVAGDLVFPGHITVRTNSANSRASPASDFRCTVDRFHSLRSPRGANQRYAVGGKR